MTNTYKPTETATFDKKLFLWADGTTKLNRRMGLWRYYDLSGQCVLERRYNLKGKIEQETYFPPEGIDPNAVPNFNDTFGGFFWELAPVNQNGENDGEHKIWVRYLADEGRALLQNDFADKSLAEYSAIWAKGVWHLSQAVGYKKGEVVWLKNYDIHGNVTEEEYTDDDTNNEIDEELSASQINALKQKVSVEGKSIAENYEDYLTLCDENNIAIKRHKKATEQEIQALENRLNTALPNALKTLYTTYANGVSFPNVVNGVSFDDNVLELLPTTKIVGIIDYIKNLQKAGFMNDDANILGEKYDTQNKNWIPLSEADNAHLSHLNSHYFVFTEQWQDADFKILLFSKHGKFTQMAYSDDYLNYLYTEYLENFEQNPFHTDLTTLWNAHLYQLKATEYNDLMENYGLEDECMTVDEMN